jgi:hypothetical protein
VAGTTTLSADADVTLSTTNGASNQARNAVILWTASNGATTRNITAPAQSKAYIVINAGTGSVVIRGSGPTTGVTVASGIKALVAWNGSDFVSVAKSLINLTSDVTGTLPIANGGTGTTATTFANLTTNVTGVLPLLNGGTGVTTPSLVAGTNVTITGTWPNQTVNASGGGGGGSVTAVPASSPLASSGGTSPNISLSGIVPVANGGTGTATPSLVQGSNVSITGSWPNQTVAVTGSGAVLTVAVFSSSLPFVVPAGVTNILCEVIGGGGGSAVAGNTGAGGGGYSYGTLAVTPGETLTITVGAGGTGNQPPGGQGTSGGTSSIVRSSTTLMSATGGGGSGSSTQFGAGGGGSGGTIYNTSGQNAQPTPGAGSTGTPGASGRGFPTSVGQQNGPGAGGASAGNVVGANGVGGQITFQYVV